MGVPVVGVTAAAGQLGPDGGNTSATMQGVTPHLCLPVVSVSARVAITARSALIARSTATWNRNVGQSTRICARVNHHRVRVTSLARRILPPRVAGVFKIGPAEMMEIPRLWESPRVINVMYDLVSLLRGGVPQEILSSTVNTTSPAMPLEALTSTDRCRLPEMPDIILNTLEVHRHSVIILAPAESLGWSLTGKP